MLLDSGFGYLESLKALKSKGSYGAMFMTKRAYQASGTESYAFLQGMAGKDKGSIWMREGTKDGTAVWITAMVDSKHTGIMVNT